MIGNSSAQESYLLSYTIYVFLDLLRWAQVRTYLFYTLGHDLLLHLLLCCSSCLILALAAEPVPFSSGCDKIGDRTEGFVRAMVLESAVLT